MRCPDWNGRAARDGKRTERDAHGRRILVPFPDEQVEVDRIKSLRGKGLSFAKILNGTFAADPETLRTWQSHLHPKEENASLKALNKIKPDTLMPAFAITDRQAADLVSYLLTAPLSAPLVSPPLKRLPPLSRRVSFDEVNERVFRRTCWHCHSTPE